MAPSTGVCVCEMCVCTGSKPAPLTSPPPLQLTHAHTHSVCTKAETKGYGAHTSHTFRSHSVRTEVEKKGLLATKESCWAYYVQKCRNNLHVVLAMSPVGETLRSRCRNFPGMVS